MVIGSFLSRIKVSDILSICKKMQGGSLWLIK